MVKGERAGYRLQVAGGKGYKPWAKSGVKV
jgi:hypothetical protein